MFRYYSLYANAHRGKVRKSERAAGKLLIIDRIIAHLKLSFQYVVDLVVLDVIILFQTVSGWKLCKTYLS
ncbi:MAG: hypothetical protein V3V48_01860 [Candidatus Aminicenantaceae bacterium]